MSDKITTFIKKIGWPRLIIGLFLIVLTVFAFFIDLDVKRMGVDVLTRFGMNAILVLSMVPMIHSGCGPNFGLPVGLIGGMLAAVISVEFHLQGLLGILLAILMAIVFGAVFGLLYGLILNKVKGDEMLIATYVGFSVVALMNIFWIILPFRNPDSVMGFKGEGLRVTISLRDYWDKSISKIGAIPLDPFGPDVPGSLWIPTGMFLFFAIFAFAVWAYFRSKSGTSMTAVGSNSSYAGAAGINVDRVRIQSVMMSSALGAVGIIIYMQSFGFIQLYNSALSFAFPSVAAILLGGASINKASIINVIIGAFLFQAILTMTPTVINAAIQIDVSEVLRIIISNGLIVYALTRKGAD